MTRDQLPRLYICHQRDGAVEVRDVLDGLTVDEALHYARSTHPPPWGSCLCVTTTPPSAQRHSEMTTADHHARKQAWRKAHPELVEAYRRPVEVES